MKPEIHKDEGYRFMAAAFEVYNDRGYGLAEESFVLSANDAAGFFEGLADVHNWAEVYPGRLDTGC